MLVERYQRRVVGVALAVVHNQDDALELAQETFVRAFQNLPRFEIAFELFDLALPDRRQYRDRLPAP